MDYSNNETSSNRVQISFDDLNRLRILDSSEFKQTEEISEQCGNLVEQISSFQTHVKSLVEILSSQSEKIKTNKMLAIGQRNRIETETETRRRKQAELQYLISQKQKELNRYTEYKDSLVKMEQEQKQIIERLTIA